MAETTKGKPEGVAALEAIIKKQEAKIEKQLKIIEEKNEAIRAKDKKLSEVDDKISQLQDIAVTAQDEVNKADTRHSEEMELVLTRLNVIDAQMKQLLSKA